MPGLKSGPKGFELLPSSVEKYGCRFGVLGEKAMSYSIQSVAYCVPFQFGNEMARRSFGFALSVMVTVTASTSPSGAAGA